MTELFLDGVMLTVMAAIAAIEIRYFWRRSSSRNWPTANATIRRRGVGKVWGYGMHAGFFEYEFLVEDIQYSRQFAILDNVDHAGQLQRKLDGAPIVVKYCSRRPKVSFLSEFRDRRFEGKLATQNPCWFIGFFDTKTIRTLDIGK